MTFLESFLAKWGELHGLRLGVGHKSGLRNEVTVIVHTPTWPRVVRLEERDVVMSRVDPETYLRRLVERIEAVL